MLLSRHERYCLRASLLQPTPPLVPACRSPTITRSGPLNLHSNITLKISILHSSPRTLTFTDTSSSTCCANSSTVLLRHPLRALIACSHARRPCRPQSCNYLLQSNLLVGAFSRLLRKKDTQSDHVQERIPLCHRSRHGPHRPS
jgi:hypothetical protein